MEISCFIIYVISYSLFLRFSCCFALNNKVFYGYNCCYFYLNWVHIAFLLYICTIWVIFCSRVRKCVVVCLVLCVCYFFAFLICWILEIRFIFSLCIGSMGNRITFYQNYHIVVIERRMLLRITNRLFKDFL